MNSPDPLTTGATLGANDQSPEGVAPIPLTDNAIRNAKPADKAKKLYVTVVIKRK